MKLLVIIGTILMSLYSAQAIVDADADGMSDVWERLYKADQLVATANDDGDDQTNLEESLAGTNPFITSSHLSIVESNYWGSAVIVEWESMPGVRYQVEQSSSLGQAWTEIGGVLVGQGQILLAAFELGSQARCFYRVKVLGNERYNNLPAGVDSPIVGHDTDKDGLSDWSEIKYGLDPFDSSSTTPAPQILIGSAMSVSWPSEKGKNYRLQCAPDADGPWVDEGAAHSGTGTKMSAIIRLSGNQARQVRVLVEDEDTDGDGVTDWEELQVGLDPYSKKTDRLGSGDLAELNGMMIASNTIIVKASQSVANITRMESGGLEIIRAGGIDELTVNYSVSGTAIPDIDYEALSGTVIIPFGKNSAIIPVRPLAASAISLTESIILTLGNSTVYDLGDASSQQVNLLKEVAINVQNYGAVGDGLNNDTGAIQDAIAALEASTTHNTLYFPSGKYRLDSLARDDETPTSYYRILQLGATDLLGRDIIVRAEEGASLFSTVSPTRAHMLVAHGSFRSLQFRGLIFEKDTVVLGEPRNLEPNGADGLSLVNVDSRKVESVELLNCQFINCHGAIGAYGKGYDSRGKLAKFIVKDCIISNLYGANSIYHYKIWGGGQLVNITSWIDHATYLNNTFDGGSKVLENPELNPLGGRKDGSHFGSPLRLDFINNLVTAMRVECVFQTHDPYMGQTQESLEIPSIGETVIVKVNDQTTNYEVGQIIAIRGSFGSYNKSVSFEIIDFDLTDRKITIRYLGLDGFDASGTVFPHSKAIYLQTEKASVVNITGNIIKPAPGADGGGQAGIAVMAYGKVHSNYIEGYDAGIKTYGDFRTPLTTASRGLVIKSNLILCANGAEITRSTTYGVHVFDSDQIIEDNTIWTPISIHTVGIAARGKDAQVINNNVIAMEVHRNGYDNPLRSVGCGVGNGSLRTWFIGNTTYGFDVGVGPINANQAVGHYILDHRSVNDELSIDPRGVIND